MLWLALGLLVGAHNLRSIQRFVAMLQPQAMRRPRLRVFLSYLMRYALNACLLLAAIQFGIREALFAFAGLWLYRWIFLMQFRRHGGISTT